MDAKTLEAWSVAIAEAVEAEVGIRLDPAAGAWQHRDGRLVLEGRGGVALAVTLEEGDDPSMVADVLPDEHDLRDGLTAARLSLIAEVSRSTLACRFKTVLGDEGWELELREAGYWPTHHAETEEETVHGYPTMVAAIDFLPEHPLAREDIELRLDPYQEPFYDEAELTALLASLETRAG